MNGETKYTVWTLERQLQECRRLAKSDSENASGEAVQAEIRIKRLEGLLGRAILAVRGHWYALPFGSKLKKEWWGLMWEIACSVDEIEVELPARGMEAD